MSSPAIFEPALPHTQQHSERLEGAVRRSSTAASLWALTKPRLSLLSVLTAVVAYAAAHPDWAWVRSGALIVGTGLAAGGALTLNQWRERDSDCIMERTQDRPLPAGQVTPVLALGWGLGLSVAGTVLLAAWVNLPAAAVAAATILLYVLAYTPMKRRSRWATEVGAVPGALPPLIGWLAAEGRIAPLGWGLFAILFFWQMPHFFAIGWVCRHEYRLAEFPLLPARDATGRRTAAWSLAHAVALVAVSLLPWAWGFAGRIYGATAMAAGAGFLALAVRFLVHAEPVARDRAARQLFTGSLAYLPLVFLVLLLDRAR